jgi:BMFP domain-containing protein YqiC
MLGQAGPGAAYWWARSAANAADETRVEQSTMTQTSNRMFDELAKLMTDAAGAAQGLRREAEAVFRSQGERWLREMDVVQREEFEAVQAMAAKAREENERLAERIAALEAEVARLRPGG